MSRDLSQTLLLFIKTLLLKTKEAALASCLPLVPFAQYNGDDDEGDEKAG